MVSDTVSHSFNEHRSGLVETDFTSLFGGVVNGENIVTVHANSGHTVRWSTDRNTVASVLLVSGCRNSVSVITTERFRLKG